MDSQGKPWLEPGPQRRPKVIWRSSIPYGWTKVMETWEIARQKEKMQRKSPSQVLDLPSRPPFKPVRVLSNPHTTQIASEPSGKFYSLKYLGITNGEIGILTQRKPIPLNHVKGVGCAGIMKAKSVIHLISEGFEDGNQSYDSHVERKTREEAANTLDEEVLVPAPEKYNEFVVNRYLKARPLTPGKRVNTDLLSKSYHQRQCMEGNATALGLQYIAPDFHPAKRQRRGVSGWKLSRPQSSFTPNRAQTASKQSFGRDKPGLSILPPDNNRSEAYIQYLLHKTRSQSQL